MATREKTTPLSFSQKLFLVKQIRDNPIVHRKPSDYNSVLERKLAWEKIARNFSVHFPVSEGKSLQQLKRTWEYLKQKEKKDHSQYIRKTHQTGGGPPPPPPKPTDEVTLLVQGILNNDLPRPSDILDSECVQSFQEEDLHPNVSSIEYEITHSAQPKNSHTPMDNPGSPIVTIVSAAHDGFPEDLQLGEPEQPPGSPVIITESAEDESLPCTSTPATSQPKSYRGQKRKAAEAKNSAHKRCVHRQIEFRDKLEKKLDVLIEKGGSTLDKIASAAEDVGAAANRIASASERIAAAIEKMANKM